MVQTFKIKKSMKFDESAIKLLVLQELRALKRISRQSVLASEMVLGNTGHRIDLAAWNGKLIGVEIKSGFDTLKRLHAQISTYMRCFDEVIVVLAQKHVEQANSILPAQIEVWTINDRGQLSIVRSAYCSLRPDPAALVQLFTLSELKHFASSVNVRCVTKGDYKRFARELPVDELKLAFSEAFRKNFSCSSRQFWNEVGRAKITQSHLTLLSRFHERKRMWHEAQVSEEEFWREWRITAQAAFQQPETAN